MTTPDWEAAAKEAAARPAGTGVSSLETLKTQSGLDFLRGIVEGRLPRPPISETLGFYLIEVERGRALFQGTPHFAHCNPLGAIHGGWTATLLDSCMACAIHSTLGVGQSYTTVEFKLNFVRPAFPDTGPMRAEGKVIHGGRTIATSEGKLYGADGKLYAHGTETGLIFTP